MGLLRWGNTKWFTWWRRCLVFYRLSLFCSFHGTWGGTNNFSELMSLKLLLIFSLEKGCNNLNFMGDSLNVINWINRTQDCRQLRLAHILYSIRLLLQRLDFYSCRHVYRDNNQEVDKASKEGLRLAVGSWTVKEIYDGRTQGFYHRPFIEDFWILSCYITFFWYSWVLCRT